MTPEQRLAAFLDKVPVTPTGTVILPDGSASAFFRTADHPINAFFSSTGRDIWTQVDLPPAKALQGSIETLDVSALVNP